MRLEPMKIVQCAIFFVKIEYKKNNSNNKWIKKKIIVIVWAGAQSMILFAISLMCSLCINLRQLVCTCKCFVNRIILTDSHVSIFFSYFSLLILCDSNPSTWFFKICTFSSLYFFFYFSIFLEFCAANEFEYSKNIAYNSCKYYSLKKEDCNQMNFNL